MPLNSTEENHESYGMIGVSRVTCRPGVNLFGSSIRHGNTVRLKIKTAEVKRDLHTDWYHGVEGLIEVELSPTQYAEMISSMNIGDGVPCTIRHINQEHMKNPPEVKQRQIFEEEFKKDVDEIKRMCDGGVKEISKTLLKKGGITVAERKEVNNQISMLMQSVNSNLPFLQKSFNESIDKTVLEAKGEVEAFVTNKVLSLGIKGLEKEMLSLGEG